MLTHIPIGPAVLPAYPFLLLIGFWAGMSVAAKMAEQRQIEGDHIYNIGLYSFIGGLLVGRFWYVVSHWEAYSSDLTEAFSLTANAIDGWAFALAALIIALFYIKRHRLALPFVADAMAFGAAVTLIFGGIGAFLGSQTLGTPTTMPWAVSLYGQLRHPAHLYLVLAVIVIFGVLWVYRHNTRWPGFLALLFLLLYATSRLLFDPFFGSPPTIGPGFRLVQVWALGIITLILILMMKIETQKEPRLSKPMTTELEV